MHHWLMHNWYAVEEIPITGTHSDDVNRGQSGELTRRATTRLLGRLALGAPLALFGLNETAAKGKHKKKKDTPKFTTVTKTVRQPLTQTFRNLDPITIPAGAPTNKRGPATPYPSAIDVAGFVNGRILDVNLILHGLSHGFPQDVEVLLAAAHLPDQFAVVLSDVGNTASVSDLTLTLDDQAAAALTRPDPLVSGTYRPTNFEEFGQADVFPAPSPASLRGDPDLSVFNNSIPNGTWQLFVVDDGTDDVGSIAGGWSLEITAEVDVEVQEQIPVQIRQKHKKTRKK